LTVSNLDAGPYTLYIGNFGNTQESVSFQVTLTSVAGARAVPASSATGALKSALRGMTVVH